MNFKWDLNEQELESFQLCKNKNTQEMVDQYYIGCVRAGNICFDIICNGVVLIFELFVGGVDTGYYYSNKDGYEDYPYDNTHLEYMYGNDFSSIEEFKRNIEEKLTAHLEMNDQYVSCKGQRVSLLAKANEDLKEW